MERKEEVWSLCNLRVSSHLSLWFMILYWVWGAIHYTGMSRHGPCVTHHTLHVTRIITHHHHPIHRQSHAEHVVRAVMADTGLWLVQSDHVTWILASNWLVKITWPVMGEGGGFRHSQGVTSSVWVSLDLRRATTNSVWPLQLAGTRCRVSQLLHGNQ